MSNLEYYSPSSTVQEDFVNLVNLELNDIKKTFVRIGFRLLEADRCKYYVDLGFSNIVDCAEHFFGFKKTTTYDLMSVALLFTESDQPMVLAPRYRKFSQSQLVLFSSIRYKRDDFIKLCSSEDSISDLRIAKKNWSSLMSGRLFTVNKSYSQCKNIREFNELCDYSRSSQLSSSELSSLSSILSGDPEKRVFSSEQAFPVLKKYIEDYLDRLGLVRCSSLGSDMAHDIIFDLFPLNFS